MYALGAVLLYAAARHCPYDGAAWEAVAVQVANPDIGPELSGVPEELKPPVASMLAYAPQGGGRRHGDRGVSAAIIFMATSGRTRQQLPSASFGPSGATAHRRFTEWTRARVWATLHRLSRTNPASAVSRTGPAARSTR